MESQNPSLTYDQKIFAKRESMAEVDRLDTFEYLNTIQREMSQTNSQDDLIFYFHSFLDAICSGHNRSFGQEWFNNFFYTTHPVAWKQSFTDFINRCRSFTWLNHKEFNELVTDFCGFLNIEYISPTMSYSGNTTTLH